VFGRRKREEEAAREAERRALFAELAMRPDTVCPFLGMATSRTAYEPKVTDDHRCYAFGDPAELSAEQQQKVCLQRGYGNCPRYLRGVLVIPTEELEALRRPLPAAPPPPSPAPAGQRGGRGGILVLALVLLLAVGGGAGAFLLLREPGGVATQTPTPDPTAEPTPRPSGTGTSVAPSQSESGPPSATPLPTPVSLPSAGASVPALPTPGPGDQSTGYIVVVTAGDYPVVRMDDDGTQLGDATAVFDDVSAAPVQRIELDEGLFWRTLLGEYTGLAYSRTLDDEFDIYETYETSDGEARFRLLQESEL